MPGRKPGSLARFRCRCCGDVELVRGGSNLFRCAPCRLAGRGLAGERPLYGLGKDRAVAAVGAAVRDGLIPPARARRCVDCGEQARDYDHRDYNKPLSVEPVCRRCNLRRGPAIPLAGTIESQLHRGLIPYRSRAATAKLCLLMGRRDLAEQLPPQSLMLADWQRIWPELIGAEGKA